jgi:hypothetical protein
MTTFPAFPTPIQEITVSLAFAAVGERRMGRSYQEYMEIAAKLPPLKQLLFKINRLLDQWHKCQAECGRSVPEICRFKAGDERIVYEPCPKTISYETLRAALTIAKMRKPRRKRHN